VRDDAGRPVAWERGGERHPVLTVQHDDVLRDALSDLIQAETRYAPVVDEHGVVAGALSIDVIGHALQTAPEEVPHGADAAIAD
jgi:CBS domain containing-hemolysin-like protein